MAKYGVDVYTETESGPIPEEKLSSLVKKKAKYTPTGFPGSFKRGVFRCAGCLDGIDKSTIEKGKNLFTT